MYIPAPFSGTDADVEELLRNANAADLITSTANGLLATYLPMIYDADAGPHGSLLVHLARNNEQWKIPPIGEVMAIVGVQLVISRVEATFKLSQNRPAADIDGVIAGLRTAGGEATSAAVEALSG